MTREEILNMPAGREMDALVAEKVMGWKIVPEISLDTGVKDEIWGKKRCDNKFIVGYPYRLTETQDGAVYSHSWKIWSPSDNILDAWEVVEKIKAIDGGKKWAVSMGRDDKWWNVIFVINEYDYDTDSVIAVAENAPLAICRAALLAVEDV